MVDVAAAALVAAAAHAAARAAGTHSGSAIAKLNTVGRIITPRRLFVSSKRLFRV